MTTIAELTDSSFDEALQTAALPLLVEFTADWCGPCKMLAPILDEISKESANFLHVAKIDVDSSPKTALRYEVMSMPTLILFQGLAVRWRVVGARGKAYLLNELADALSLS